MMTVLLLVCFGAVITYMSSQMFEASSKDRELNENVQQARARANEVEGLLVTYIDKVKVIASQLLKEYPNEKARQEALQLTFYGDRDLVSIEVREKNKTTPTRRVVNNEFLSQFDLDENYINVVRLKQSERNLFQEGAVFAGKVEVRNASFGAKMPPLLTIGIPFVKDDFGVISHIAIAEIRLDRLQKVFGVLSARTTYLVDREGYLLAHPEESRVLASQSFKGDPMVWEALNTEDKEGATKFTEKMDPQGHSGAFNKTSLGVTVVTTIPNAVILEVSEQVRFSAMRLTGQALSLSLFIVFLFSISLTHPIERLVDVTHSIAKGDFDHRANIGSADEVGLLGQAIDEMAVGLKERDKVKNVLNKFHGSSVTDELIQGDLELGGSSKNVTVFFSDIRDFTKFSEAHTAEQVVSMLNEYFQVMVSIINRNNGVVDKFIGDAIMAVWGAPTATDEDPQNAVKACLEMRVALQELNRIRIGRGEVPLKIGIGLHTGRVISGTIGSDERMEFTVIGDAVNQAARIEASTKAFGADLLLSKETADLVRESFMIAEAGKVEVKGKSEALSLFKVRGYVDADGKEVELRTEYSDYESSEDDKVKMAG